MTATDFHFGPPALTADAGSTTFKLTNNGQTSHALTIEGNGIEETSDTISPGDSTELTVDLAEGEYEIYCPVDGRKDMGMVGTLTVGSGGGGATTTDDSGGEPTTTGVPRYLLRPRVTSPISARAAPSRNEYFRKV